MVNYHRFFSANTNPLPGFRTGNSKRKTFIDIDLQISFRLQCLATKNND